MKLTSEMISKAKAIADSLSLDYDKIGIRVQEVPFDLGEMDHQSHVWVDGDETDELLPGVSAQDIKTIDKYTNEYFGAYVAIVAGNEYEYGEDAGEIIIPDPVVVAVLA